LATEQRCQESAERAVAMAENALAGEQCRRESAERAVGMAEKALAKEQGLSLLAKMALAEYNAQTIASWDAATVEAVAMGVMALTKLKAAPKLRYGGPPPTHFSPPLTAKEVAKLDAVTLDKRHRAAAQEKALADKANEQRWAAARDKALADEANKQRRHELAKGAMTSATRHLPRTSTTRTTTMLRGDLRHTPHPSSLVLTLSWPKSEPWMTVSAPGLHLVTRSSPRRTTKPQLQRCRPRHPQRPCRQPPTTLLRIRTRSLLSWGGAFAQSL